MLESTRIFVIRKTRIVEITMQEQLGNLGSQHLALRSREIIPPVRPFSICCFDQHDFSPAWVMKECLELLKDWG